MYFTKLLFFITFASASVVQRALPNGQTAVQDIINIHNAVLALDAQIQNYQGAPFPTSLVNGTRVLEGVAEIHRVNRAGFRHALVALPYTKDDSVDVINTVLDTVNISIPNATDHIKAKVNEFKKSSFVPVVIASLGLLLSDHDTFSAAVFIKLTGLSKDQLAQGSGAVANIHNSIQDATLFYTANLA